MKKNVWKILTVVLSLGVSAVAFADDGSGSGGAAWLAIAAALCMGAGTFGGALGQSKTAAAALEGIARNPQAAPKVQTPMIIALAMTESLVLFALVIAFFLQGKIAG